MRRTVAPIVVAGLASLLGGIACGGDLPNSPGNHDTDPVSSIAPPPGGVAQFSVMPVAIAKGLTLTALGSLNPPGHVLPTDHVYFYDWDLATGADSAEDRAVFMPTTATVIQVILPTGTDTKVVFRATQNFFFYFDHLLPSAPFTVGQTIPVGTQIGTTGVGVTLDLGAFDESVTHSGFVNPDRYGVQTKYYVSPWKYFTPELQAQIYTHVYRAPSAPDKDGRIDFGVAGTLAGDWFLPGMPADSSWQPYGWTRSISFAYDYYDPTQVRVSIGGTVGAPGVWGIDVSAPQPDAVTPASGVVAYRLYGIFDKHPLYGLMLVQMTDASTVKAEIFPGSTATTASFDAQAVTFIR
ncbi:MAG: hypothetical protein ACREPM_05060 [Gemmatimonadaceae bacterium]